MTIVFFIIGYLFFAWLMGRILNALLEKLLEDETRPIPSEPTNIKQFIKVAPKVERKSAPETPSMVFDMEAERKRTRRNEKVST